MFNLHLCNTASTWYSQLKFGHMHLCSMDYKYFSLHCRKCNSFGCTAAIRCGYACRGPHSDSLYSGSEHRQFNSPRLIKREAGFPNPRRALIGSNQLWRVNDSPYYHHTTTLVPFNHIKLYIWKQHYIFVGIHQAVTEKLHCDNDDSCWLLICHWVMLTTRIG